MVVNEDDENLTPRAALSFFASKLVPTGLSHPHKCVHTNVTLGAIYVCTFRFYALKSYIHPA